MVPTTMIVRMLESQTLCEECMPGPGSSGTAEQMGPFQVLNTENYVVERIAKRQWTALENVRPAFGPTSANQTLQ